MDILGTITSCVDLGERVWSVAQKYAGASQSAADMRLFDYDLNIVRLHLLRSGLQRCISKLNQDQQHRLRNAATKLESGLLKAQNYLDRHPPNRKIERAQWAIWEEDEAVNLFRKTQSRFEKLEAVVTLAELAPSLRSLSPVDDSTRFEIPRPDQAKALENAPVGYSLMAMWSDPDGSKRERRHDPVRVFVESYRPQGTNVGDAAMVEAREKARLIAEKLWWTCESAELHTTILPCIGFQDYRVVFLLPKNVGDQKTLGGVIRSSGIGRSKTGVSIEARYRLALQLAEAVLKVHSAGLMHRAIRDNTILFLTPNEQGMDGTATVPGHDQEGKNDAAEPKPLKRTDTWGKLTRTVSKKHERPDTVRKKSSQGSLRKKGANPALSTVKRILGHRNPSGTDLASLDDTGSAASTQLGLLPGHRDDPQQPTNATGGVTVGNVPPGSGSIYLIYWNSMTYRGHGAQAYDKAWFKDIYRHPEQQFGSPPSQYNMGHDIYSFGVCLIEIGLWETFVLVRSNDFQRSRLAGRLGITPMAGYDPIQVKQRLVDLAMNELPQAIGEGYARLVKACLTCLDKDGGPNWNVDFKELNRQNDCRAFRENVISFLRRMNDAFASS
ncbi:hypothetical protein PV04_06380 [Phialophora macrospora]|uniref:Protein kinase domain-containing protein n=1 Tax=Phialophora macrospora TaxID=1851006 RepID=A0A0D2DY96_9EURO|nr:hypothetical protein PV04_06380 [Phialophora macrospora]